MSPHQALHYLDSFINFELGWIPSDRCEFKLARIEELLNNLDNPHHRLRCVHIAGTKGKGSTSQFIASILKSAGYSVGLYTSPHLHDRTERIRILKKEDAFSQGSAFDGLIPVEDLVSLVEETKPAVEKTRGQFPGERLTFFEVYTALALYYFYQKAVDIVVLETGLGGRLDATNIVTPLVSVLTPIGLEHTEILGNQIEDIAREKAGIITKTGQKVVISLQDKKTADVIAARCREKAAHCFWQGVDFDYTVCAHTSEGICFSYTSEFSAIGPVKSPLVGRHQAQNAAVAIAAVEVLSDYGFVISPENICLGIEMAVLPGRFETVKKRHIYILDCAHTPDSIQKVVSVFKELYPNKKCFVIMGVSREKDYAMMASSLADIAEKVIVTHSRHPRARKLTREEVVPLFPGKEVACAESCAQALAAIDTEAEGARVLVTGSVFLVAEAREILIGDTSLMKST